MRLNTTKRMITVRQCWHGTNLSQKSNTLDKYANVGHNQLYMDLLFVGLMYSLGSLQAAIVMHRLCCLLAS